MTWERVQLADLLHEVRRPVSVESTVLYSQIGIRSFGKGIFHKNPVSGAELGSKRVFWIQPGDFILNIVFAWEGAVAIAGHREQGFVGSHRFPTYLHDERRVEPRFLLYYFGTLEGRALLLRVSPGGAGRNRTLNRTAFLRERVPLPSLREQQRIVARLDDLLSRMSEANALRTSTREGSETLFQQLERRLWRQASVNVHPLHRVTTFLQRGRQSKQGESEHFLIKTQHVQMGQLLPTSARLAEEVAKKVAFDALVQQGDILIACSAAGCLGRVAWAQVTLPENASTDTHVAIARAREDAVSPAFLYHYLVGAEGQFQLRSRERGDWQREKVGFRLTELNLADLKQVPVPVPPPAVQAQVVREAERIAEQRTEALSTMLAAREESDRLATSLVDAAFSGRL